MPSISKTKSGERYRAPTDQARKMERKRENKRNKRDRLQIRQAMAKYCNLDETTAKLLVLERQILGLDPQPFHIDVLKKKQKVLTDLINKRRLALQQAKDEVELKKFNDKVNIYHADCRKLAVLAEQARLARETVPEFIPLPSGDLGAMTSILPPPPIVKKKVDFQLPPKPPKMGTKPPGPPCGLAPDFSDSEEEDYNDNRVEDDDLAPVPIPDFEHRPVYPGHHSIYRNPGPSYNSMPPRMPPYYPSQHPMHLHHQYNPMGFSNEDAVISSAPQINRNPNQTASSSEAPAILSAAPELRNLRKETVKLVPTQLIRKNEVKSNTRQVVHKKRPEAQQQAKSTDEAYNEFMKELDGLI